MIRRRVPKVWIDGDGCPRAIKEIVFRAAEKRGIDVVLVANRAVLVPRSARIRTVVVEKGLDVADAWLVANAGAGDLVVTSDVPLAAELVAKGVIAMSSRGETYTASNVREKLSLRDFFTEARESGMTGGGGPPPLDEKTIRAFANAFDRWLTAALRR
jgi:uncharacterized protein YaiI (UPF0178 family)